MPAAALALAIEESERETTPHNTPIITTQQWEEITPPFVAPTVDIITEDDNFANILDDAIAGARHYGVTYHVTNGVTNGTTGGSYMTWGTGGVTCATTAPTDLAIAGTLTLDSTTNTLYLCNGPSTGAFLVNSQITTGAVTAAGSWVPLDNLIGSRYTIREDGSVIIHNDGQIVCVSETPESKEMRIKNQIKQIMKTNLLIKNNSRHLRLGNIVSVQEEKARETLRDMISERDWRRYLTNGFVIVKAPSGKFYQIFNDQRHVKVYQKGILTDEICIHTHADTKCPPTDHILNLMFLVQNDESLIWAKGVGNVYSKQLSVSGNAVNANGVNVGYVQENYACVGGISTIPYTGEKGCKTLLDTYRKLKAA